MILLFQATALIFLHKQLRSKTHSLECTQVGMLVCFTSLENVGPVPSAFQHITAFLSNVWSSLQGFAVRMSRKGWIIQLNRQGRVYSRICQGKTRRAQLRKPKARGWKRNTIPSVIYTLVFYFKWYIEHKWLHIILG